MKLPNFNSYTKGPLSGTYEFFTKLDGVCVHIHEESPPTSKRGKPLYNMPDVAPGIYEAFKHNWETTVSLARTKNSEDTFKPHELYQIYPKRDPRLYIGTCINPKESFIKMILNQELKKGHEGIIIWPKFDCRSTKPIKVKDAITIDIRITGIQPGTGKYEGMMGALLTSYGKVGTGFTDSHRAEEWTPGEIIEVEFMEWTKDNKMRHPRFIRRRPDKDTENLEGLKN
jgi:hypothetical protein